jgi:replication factor A1
MEKYAKEIDELVKAIGKSADREEIENEFEKYVVDFKIPVFEAKMSIARKYGVSVNGQSESVERTLAELQPGENNVNLLCRVVFTEIRNVTASGEEKTIISGILGDNSGTRPFTIWEMEDLELEKGDVIQLEGAYTTEWKGEAQVNVSIRGAVTKKSKDALPGRSVQSEARTVKIGEIGDDSGNFNIVGRILSMEEREVTVKGEAKDVISGVVADETGKISFSCWGKCKIKRGDVIEANNGYIRFWKGMPQLNVDATRVSKSKEKLPKEEKLALPSKITVDSLVRSGGMLDALVSGVILDVREGSGLIFRCPECNRVVRKNSCKIHGDVEGLPDLRVKAVMDDGTGALNVIMGKELSEKLLDSSLDDCLKQAKKTMDQGIVRDELFNILVARPMEVIGNVSSDDFGLMMIANDVEFINIDVHNEAKSILEELE